MGIYISAFGQRGDEQAETFVQRLLEWFDDRVESDLLPSVREVKGGFVIELGVCAGCSPVVVSVYHTDGLPEALCRAVSLEPQTSPGGPGYHRFVCELIEGIGSDLGVQWEEVEDETGYFESHDLGALEGHMLGWFQALCEAMLGQDAEAKGSMICLPAGLGAGFPDGEVLTPLGPKSFDWMRRCASDAEAAREFFLWWSDREHPRSMLNRVLSLLWCDVVWVEAWTEQLHWAQTRALDLALALHEADPTADVPWKAIDELVGVVGIDGSEEGDRAKALVGQLATDAPASAPVGYRRHACEHRFGPWRFELPGWFEVEFDGEKVVAEGGPHSVVFVPVGAEETIDVEDLADHHLELAAPEQREGLERIRWAEGSCAGCASLMTAEQEDAKFRWLVGAVASGNEGALVLVSSEKMDIDEWAVSVWKTVRALEE